MLRGLRIKDLRFQPRYNMLPPPLCSHRHISTFTVENPQARREVEEGRGREGGREEGREECARDDEKSCAELPAYR